MQKNAYIAGVKTIIQKILCAALIFLPSYGFAQTAIVLDRETKERLAYVIVAFPQHNQHLYTTRDGVFSIPTNYTPSDSVIVSVMGYQKLSTTISALRDTIFLTAIQYALPEAIVRPAKSVTLGFTQKKLNKHKYSFGWRGDQFVAVSVATYIANDILGSATISTLLFRYRQTDPNIRYIVRPQVYAVDSDGRPGPYLLIKSQVFTLIGDGVLEVPCNPAIDFPSNGVFVGLEIVEAIDQNGNSIVAEPYQRIEYPFLNTTSSKQAFTYLSLTNRSDWFLWDVPQEKAQPNAAFGIILSVPQ